MSFRTTNVPSLIATSNDREPPSGSPQITVNTHRRLKAKGRPAPPGSGFWRGRRRRKVPLLRQPAMPARPPLTHCPRPPSQHTAACTEPRPRRGGPLPWSRPGDRVPAPRPGPSQAKGGAGSLGTFKGAIKCRGDTEVSASAPTPWDSAVLTGGGRGGWSLVASAPGCSAPSGPRKLRLREAQSLDPRPPTGWQGRDTRHPVATTNP